MCLVDGHRGHCPACRRERSALDLVFACRADNDLYRVMTAGTPYPRYETPAEAIQAAPDRSGLLVLADGYPAKTTTIERRDSPRRRKRNSACMLSIRPHCRG